MLKISLFCKRRRIGWAAASRRIPGLLVADTTPTDAFHRYGAFANQRDGGAGQNGPVDVSHPRLQQSHGKSATKKKNYFFETIRVDMCTMKLVSQIKGLLDYNSLCIGPVCWQSPCRLEAQREEDGEKVTSYDSSSLVGPISLTLR